MSDLASDYSWFGTGIGTGLRSILDCESLEPGDPPSYSVCKEIFVSHVLGYKMAATPIELAQSQQREIAVPAGPEGVLVERFQDEWERLKIDASILSVEAQARVYGTAAVAGLTERTEKSTDKPLSDEEILDPTLTFNVYDPLNFAGSRIGNQTPNTVRFQKWGDLVVSGQTYHRSRTRTVMNEMAIYLAWTSSAYGFVGRSVYARALFPLKSFLLTMITDDLVAFKAGVVVVKQEQAGSVVDRVMQAMFGLKRQAVKQANVVARNVLGIGTTEDVTTLNMMNINNAMAASRDNIIKNIATSAPMPAKLLTEEAFVLGFGEGSEDARYIAHFIDRKRIEMRPTYAFFDDIVMRRAWSPAFWETTRDRLQGPERDDYRAAFYAWKNSFKTSWPSLLTEPDSKLAEVEEVKFKSVIAVVEVLGPMLDPINRGRLIEWATQNLNESSFLFPGSHFDLDTDAFVDFASEQHERQSQERELESEGPHPAPPFSARDSRRERDTLSLAGISPRGIADLRRIMERAA